MRFVQHRAYSILNMSHDGMQMSYLNEMSYAGRWPYDPAWIKKADAATIAVMTTTLNYRWCLTPFQWLSLNQEILSVFEFHPTLHLDFEIDLLASSISPDVVPARTNAPTCSIFVSLGLGKLLFLDRKTMQNQRLVCRLIIMSVHKPGKAYWSKPSNEREMIRCLCRGTKSFLLVFSFLSFLGTRF